jgi:hypothetical protein
MMIAAPVECDVDGIAKRSHWRDRDSRNVLARHEAVKVETQLSAFATLTGRAVCERCRELRSPTLEYRAIRYDGLSRINVQKTIADTAWMHMKVEMRNILIGAPPCQMELPNVEKRDCEIILRNDGGLDSAGDDLTERRGIHNVPASTHMAAW